MLQNLTMYQVFLSVKINRYFSVRPWLHTQNIVFKEKKNKKKTGSCGCQNNIVKNTAECKTHYRTTCTF